MRCPSCGHEWNLPGPQAGGRAKVAKGFAVTPLSAEARARAWKTRKARAKRSPNDKDAGAWKPRRKPRRE